MNRRHERVSRRHSGGLNITWADGHAGWISQAEIARGKNGSIGQKVHF